MLCYNCYFLFIGDVFNEKQVVNIEHYTKDIHLDAQTDWEIDEEYIQQLKEIGEREHKTEEGDGSEYISRL